MKERQGMFQPVRDVVVKVISVKNKIKQFCLIQLQILTQKEKDLRKEILDCKIQKEFLTGLLSDIEDDSD